jgi:sec-independent protein translocase protein TatA
MVLMMGLGVTELVIILVIVIVLFGASRLPQIGRGLGEGIANFKRSVKTGKDPDEESKSESKS